MKITFNSCIVSKYGHSCLTSVDNFALCDKGIECIISKNGHSCILAYPNAENFIISNVLLYVGLLYVGITSCIVIFRDIYEKIDDIKSTQFILLE